MRHSQSGFVSIIVASILMVIMTLITIGFTQIMQREQRQALDRQLSTQAYYAAESAINDFYIALQARFEDPTTYEFPQKQKFTCDTDEFPAIEDGVLDGGEGIIQYTCLQYDLDPETIELDNGSVSTNQSKVIPIRLSDTSGGNVIDQITLAWDHQDGSYGLDGTSCGADQNNFVSALPNNVPIMRVDLLRLPNIGATGADAEIDLQESIDETLNLYLNPKDNCGLSAISYGEHDEPDEKGKIIQVNCNEDAAERDCSLQIDIPASRRSNQYMMRLRSVYANANATISARDTVTGTRTELTDAQVLVDATGKANDVVRRIQVRLQAIERQITEYSIPEPVFQAMDGFCKVFSVTPRLTDPNDPTSVNPNRRVDFNDSVCI